MRRFITIRSDADPFSELSDSELIKYYRESGNKEVLGEFFNRYMHLVFAVCMKYLKNTDSAKDTVMEIFESLDEKLLEFNIQYFKGWIHMVSRNDCLMKLRKAKREVNIEKWKIFRNSDVENASVLHQDNEEEIAINKINGSFRQLKSSQRKCLEMMYFQNMSYKEIATETGYTLKQVKSYIQNGKRKLKLLVKDRK
jgi:RNA polymerase sigma factor (sigma-70 family)